jgi:predicted TPR repeat methyltransferase
MPPPRLADRLAAGFRLHEAGRLAEAAEIARKLVKQAPELAGAHYLAGLVALDRGKPAQAAKHLATAARLGPESAALHQARGVAELRGGHPAQAVTAFEAAVSLAPGHAPTALLLAEARLANGDEDAALTTIDEVLAGEPAQPDAQEMRGTILRHQGRLAESIAAFEQALATRPAFVSALSNLGGTLIETGEPQRAIPLLRQALEQEPEHLPAARNLGMALDAIGAQDAAAHLFAALAESGDDEALLALGQLDLRRGRTDDAARSFATAIARQPRSVRAHFGLGEALREAGDATGAADSYRICLRLDPEDAIGAGLALSLVGGAAPAAPTGEFVRALFDAYAGRFDRALTEQLAYRGPTLLRDALDPLISDLPKLTILDLGCGTGLAGAAFADRAAAIDGIDLSPRMIDRARERGLYRSLLTADLIAGIGQLPLRSYDLALAADVLVYLGDLRPLADTVHGALKPDGLFAFTVEHLPDDRGDYALLPSKRYAHARTYIERLALPGFALVRLGEVSTRTDRGVPVPGLLTILRKLPIEREFA